MIVAMHTVWMLCALIGGAVTQPDTLPSMPCLNTATGLNNRGRVVGGVDSKRGETPYIVSLTRRGGHFCGAVVINERFLLTAGHCVCNGVNKIMQPKQVKAILGLYKHSEYHRGGNGGGDNTNSVDDHYGSNNEAYEVSLRTIISHPEYRCEKTSNDIALLELNKPIQFTDSVKPTCIALPHGSRAGNDRGIKSNYDGISATVSGWGWTKEDQEFGSRADVLQKAIVNVWTNEKCQKSFESNNKPHVIAATQLCAGRPEGGVDSCWADSGGPLTTDDNILIGIVSTGVGCARPGLPGIYTRVSEYAHWIEKVVYGQK